MNTLEAIKEQIAAHEAATNEAINAIAPTVVERQRMLPARFWAAVNKLKHEKPEGNASTKPIESTPVNQFRMIAAASVMGLASIGVLQLGQASGDYFYFDRTRAVQNQIKLDTTIAASQIAAQGAIEQSQVQTARQTADTYASNQIADIDYLIADGYLLNYLQPPDLSRFQSIDPAKFYMVVDQKNRCVGAFQGGVFTFIVDNPKVCETSNP